MIDDKTRETRPCFSNPPALYFACEKFLLSVDTRCHEIPVILRKDKTMIILQTSTTVHEFDFATIAIAILVAIIGWLGVYYNNIAQATRDERATLQKQLDEFYGPIQHLRMESNTLYENFISARRAANPEFRTLIELAKNGKSGFSSTERAILEQIVEIGNEIRKIIGEKSGLVEDRDLTSKWLPLLTTHIRLFKLAWEEKLSHSHLGALGNHTFPNGVDEAIAKGRATVIERKKALTWWLFKGTDLS